MAVGSSTRFIIGRSHGFHDGAVAVLDTEKNKIEFAHHTERTSGVKHDKNPYPLEVYTTYNEFNPKRAFYEKPRFRQLRQWLSGQTVEPKEFGYDHYVRHHWAHAAASYYTRPKSWTEEPVCIVVDSVGEFETASIWYKKRKVWSEHYPLSLGLFYSAITQHIGLQPNRDEHLTMALAGTADKLDEESVSIIDELYQIASENLHRGIPMGRLNGIDNAVLAKAAQTYLELRLMSIALQAREYSKYLCYGGGVALNCVANSKLANAFEDTWIFPNPGDAGAAFGAAAAVHDQHIEFEHNFLGIHAQGEEPNPKDIARQILRDGVVGVCYGRDEYGPRALGNRSLLADPRGGMASKIYEIKNRATYSPLAPAILSENFNNYFSGRECSYMSFVSEVIEPERHPSFTHVDNTARVQSVSSSSTQSLLRKILEEWYDLTGCPILINTSLNFKGNPTFSTRGAKESFERLNGIKVF